MTKSTENTQWTLVVKRPHTTLFIDFLLSSQSENRWNQELGIEFNFSNIKKEGESLFYDRRELKRAESCLYADEGLGRFIAFSEACRASCKRLAEYGENNQDINWAQLSTEQLEEEFKIFTLQMIAHAPFVPSIGIYQLALLNQIAGILQKSETKPENDVYRDIVECIIPKSMSQKAKSGEEILRIVEDITENLTKMRMLRDMSVEDLIATIPTAAPRLWEKIKEFTDKFSWMGKSYFFGRGFSEFDVVERLKSAATHPSTNRKNNRSHLLRRYMEQAHAANLNGKNLNFLISGLRILDELAYLKELRLDVMFTTYEKTIGVFEEIGARCSIKPSDLLWLRVVEIERLLKGKSVCRDVVEGRRQYLSAIMAESEIRWDCTTMGNQVLTAPSVSAKQPLKGTPCSRGIVSGHAYRVDSTKDVSSMEGHGILICSMMLPNMIFAVDQAAGIIAEEGGLLSHAAILARERGLPCLVGVTDATRIIRSGDHIKVNADKGTIEWL